MALPPIFTLLGPADVADAESAIARAVAVARADAALARAVALEADGVSPLDASDIADSEIFGF